MDRYQTATAYLHRTSDEARVIKSDSDLVKHLREQIVRALHTGQLHTGHRLTSIREVASAMRVDHRAVTRAYRLLEAEGLVEIRGRSGMFVAPQERLGGELVAETARWIASVVVEGWKRKIRMCDLPSLIRRSTMLVRLQGAAVESNEDSMVALCTQLGGSFALDCRPIYLDTLPVHTPGKTVNVEQLPTELREADLVVTTPFCAGAARTMAALLGKPLVVVTANPDIGPTIERRLREGRVNAVIVDVRFAERLRSVYGGMYNEQMRIVLANDSGAVAALDPSEPVILTDAARLRLGDMSRYELVPHSPCMSAESAQTVAELLIRLNLEAEQ